MSFTVSQQTRQARTSSGTLQYEILAEVTDAGDLPDKNLFVMMIVDREDPKTDTFARIATVADLGPVPPTSDGLSIDRPTALLLTPEPDTAYYRINLATFIYTDLATAVAAQDVLKTRLDELVTDWQTYLGQFLADGSIKPIDVTDHPRYTQDAYTALVQSYVTAVKTEATAKLTVDTAKEAYDAAVAAAALAQTAVTQAQGIYNDCLVAKNVVDAFAAGMYSFINGAAQTYRNTTPLKGGSPDAETTYDTGKNTALALTDPRPGCATFCGDRQTDLTNAQIATATANTNVASARTTYEDAKAAHAAAQAATEANLAAVRSLKPSFDPLTDIPAGVS
jgi:hypothetical protein